MELAVTLVKHVSLILVSYFALVIGYRIFLHPLRGYPGPLIAKISDVYAGYHAVAMRLHLVTSSDLKKYGPVIRHGPNKLVFSSAAALQDIYNNERITKSHVYSLTITSDKPSIFNALDRRVHRDKRRLIGQAISDKATRSFEPTMLEQIDIFVEQLLLAAQESASVNMTALTKRLGADIVGHLAFGFPLNLQTDPAYRFVLDGLAVGTYQHNSFMQFPMLKKLGLDRLLILAGSSQVTKYERLLQQMITSRLSQDRHAKNDLYSFVVDHLDDPTNGVTTSELWSEALFFFPAGGDTATTVMSALFFYLSRNNDIYDKLATEIRQTFATEADIRGGPRLASCRYLRACIDEALRMSPPVSGTLWRELYPDERRKPFVVDGHVIPPGTQVGVSTYALHHDEDYFSAPFAFRPERWLTEDQATLSRMHSAFCAFSLGPRGCAGKTMAYLEASLVLAKTLWRFDFEAASGREGERMSSTRRRIPLSSQGQALELDELPRTRLRLRTCVIAANRTNQEHGDEEAGLPVDGGYADVARHGPDLVLTRECNSVEADLFPE
ncbi:cytochrome P450 [Xylaria cf. heliscus]|nr:cytochrome P450 [Xylaria cf. heliscus]